MNPGTWPRPPRLPGRRPVGRIAPQTRLLAACGVGAACLLAPADATGAALAAVALMAWLAACRPPLAATARASVAGLFFFLPYAAAVVLSGAGEPVGGGPGAGTSAAMWTLWRGLGVVLTSAGLSAALTASEVGTALLGLRAPDAVSALVQQILHQTTALARETRRIAAAMAFRGAIGSGRQALTIFWSFPGVWLPRVMARAGRVGTAMELRGYTGTALVDQDVPRLRRTDLVVMGATVLGVGAAAALRWGGAR
jgi:energy-coupling factor transporter transmembrane protein EcfT